MKIPNLIASNIVLSLFVLPLFLLGSKEYFGFFIRYSVYVIPIIIGSIFIINNNINKKDLISILIIFLLATVSLAFSNGGIGSILILLMSVLMVQVLSTTSFPPSYIRIIPLVGFCLVILLFIKSFAVVDDFKYFQETENNPNTMAYFIVYGFVYWFAFTNFSRLLNKVLCVALLIVAFYGIYNFSSRGAASAFICFFLMNLLPVRIYKSNYFINMLWLFVLISILFPLFYVYLYNNFIDISLFNKSLYTGREEIWLRMFNAFGENPLAWLFGLGSHTELWVGHNLNVHNNFWAVLVNFGIFGFIMYYVFIIGKIKELTTYMGNTMIRRLVIGFISYALFAGILESTTFWMPVLIYIYWGLGFSLSHVRTLNNTL